MNNSYFGIFVLWLITFSSADKDFVSMVRQQFDEKTNSDLVSQMAAFQRASLVYMAYASYFNRADVSLPGFRHFFLSSSETAMKDSQTILDYINMRGGHQQFPIIDMKNACEMMKVPFKLIDAFDSDHDTPQICEFILKKKDKTILKKKKYSFQAILKSKNASLNQQLDWRNGLMGLRDGLLMERSLHGLILDVADGAARRGDKHTFQHLEESFFKKQTEGIKKLGDLVNRLKLYEGDTDYALGEYSMDIELKQ